MKKLLFSFLILTSIFSFGFFGSQAKAAEIRPILFPVIGKVTYYDDFSAPRVGHTHEGNDLMGQKLMLLVAAVDGVITFTPYPEPSYGYMISIRDKDGYTYNYLHVNNDNPGTDDGAGGGINAYAPDILDGNPVVKGQLVGWMGDSGNAETTQAHLHFEIRQPDGTAISPFDSLQAAPKITAPTYPYPPIKNEILPYGNNFMQGANIAYGKFNSDSQNDFVSAPMQKGGPHVKTYSSDGTLLSQFMAYDPKFSGGIDVATGDIDGDGIDEIITAPNAGGGPHIKIFKPDGTLAAQFMAYDPKFNGGVRVTTADIDNDGKDEIITAPASKGGPHLKIFKSDGTLINQFMAYDPNFHGGVDVSASGKGSNARIVTAPGFGGGPHVKVFSTDGILQSQFMAYDPNFHGGIHISFGDARSISLNSQIITIPASGGGPDVRIFDSTGQLLKERMEFEPWWIGGYDITIHPGGYFISSGLPFETHTRRTSVRSNSY